MYRTRSDGFLTKNYWWRVCVNCPSLGHSQLLWDPLPPLYNTSQCAWPFMKGQKWTEKWARVKNMWPYKYQSQTASSILSLPPLTISPVPSPSPTVGVSRILHGTSDQVAVKSRPWLHSSPGDVSLHPVWSPRAINLAFSFSPWRFLATGLYQCRLRCSSPRPASAVPTCGSIWHLLCSLSWGARRRGPSAGPHCTLERSLWP